jgi:hypothetical protein
MEVDSSGTTKVSVDTSKQEKLSVVTAGLYKRLCTEERIQGVVREHQL